MTGYREKPTISYDVSMGVYVFNRSVVDLIEPDTRVDFPDVVMTLVRQGRNVKVYQSNDEWLDIGRIDDYAHATETFQALRHKFLPEKRREPQRSRELGVESPHAKPG